IGVRAAQRRVGEAREALGALALAVVEVVADGADEAERRAVEALKRAAQQRVGLALAVGVGGQDGVDAVAGTDQREEALVVERIASSAPDCASSLTPSSGASCSSNGSESGPPSA